jgi:hypothetical protein
MIAAVIAIVVILWLLSGLGHHANHRLRGRRVNIGWSLARGPFASVRFLGGRYYHRL